MAMLGVREHTRNESNRKLKSHKKSRGGCGNCKLRKVKCDERKPSCQKCKDYGTFCNYNPKYAALHPVAGKIGKFDISFQQQLLCSEKQSILSFINNGNAFLKLTSSDALESQGADVTNRAIESGYQFSIQDLGLIQTFNTSTVFTLVQLGARNGSHVYQNSYAKLAFSHPFLMHIILTLTMAHTRQLLDLSNPQKAAETDSAIAFHWSRGAALLNHALSTDIPPSARDALWATAGLLGALAFSSLSATTPAQAWPLKPSSPADLDWLGMTEGKKAIWKIANPMREDSIFYPHVLDFLKFASPPVAVLSQHEMQNLPAELVRLCGLDRASPFASTTASPAASQSSTDSLEDNPYLAPAVFLASSMAIPCTTKNIGLFLGFFGSMHPAFKLLLKEKDPCAMLLLACWYTKLCECPLWWSWRRAHLESRSICSYLALHPVHSAYAEIMGAVRWLGLRCPSMAVSNQVEMHAWT